MFLQDRQGYNFGNHYMKRYFSIFFLLLFLSVLIHTVSGYAFSAGNTVVTELKYQSLSSGEKNQQASLTSIILSATDDADDDSFEDDERHGRKGVGYISCIDNSTQFQFFAVTPAACSCYIKSCLSFSDHSNLFLAIRAIRV